MIVLLEAFDLFDVVDVVSDFLELSERFGWNNIAQIFFKLHGQFDGVQGIKSVISEGTLPGDT